MISAQLLSGDYSIGADGTVTCIDGDRIYAFGHRFLDAGPSDIPFARAEVLALLPNVSSSFKISAAREWMGTLTDDRNTAVSGVMGRRAAMAPVDIRVGKNSYHMQVIQDRVMTPLVTQMALFSAIDATERAQGGSTFSVRGHLDFEGGSVRVDNVYSGDVAVPALAALGRRHVSELRDGERIRRVQAERRHAGDRRGGPQEPDADRRYRRAAQRAAGRGCRADRHAGRRKRRRDAAQGSVSRAGGRAAGADQFHRGRCDVDQHDWSSARPSGRNIIRPDRCWIS